MQNLTSIVNSFRADVSGLNTNSSFFPEVQIPETPFKDFLKDAVETADREIDLRKELKSNTEETERAEQNARDASAAESTKSVYDENEEEFGSYESSADQSDTALKDQEKNVIVDHSKKEKPVESKKTGETEETDSGSLQKKSLKITSGNTDKNLEELFFTRKEKLKEKLSDTKESLIEEKHKKKELSENPASKPVKAETVQMMLDPEKWKIAGSESKNSDNLTLKLEGSDEKKSVPVKNKTANDGNSKNGDESSHQKSSGQDFRSLFLDQKNEVSQTQLRNTEQSRQAESKMFNQLVDKALINLGADGNSTASIRMNPESLGRLTMNLRVTDNHVEAKLLVDSEAAKGMIKDEIENLRMELRSQGITVDTFTIKVRESLFSNMNFDKNGDELMFQNQSFGDPNFSGNDNETFPGNELFSQDFSGMFDDNEYDSMSFTAFNREYEGTVNLSV